MQKSWRLGGYCRVDPGSTPIQDTTHTRGIYSSGDPQLSVKGPEHRQASAETPTVCAIGIIMPSLNGYLMT
jgi:hypothetical protein